MAKSKSIWSPETAWLVNIVAIGNPSSTCAKLHCGSKQQYRDHALQSLIIACSCHAYIFMFFVHILFMVNHTINATPLERLHNITP